jgi:hypothetical protein
MERYFVSKTANNIMGEYVSIMASEKALEKRRKKLRHVIMGYVKAGFGTQKDYAALISNSSCKTVKLSDVIAKFGAKRVAPLIRTTTFKKLLVRKRK